MERWQLGQGWLHSQVCLSIEKLCLFTQKISRFLLDWAWGRVAGIKEQIDRQTLPLFDFSLLEVEGGSRGEMASLAGLIMNLLKSSLKPDVKNLAGQLAQLVTVLSSLASLAPATTTAGLEELEVESDLDLPVGNLLRCMCLGEALCDRPGAVVHPSNLLVCCH